MPQGLDSVSASLPTAIQRSSSTGAHESLHTAASRHPTRIVGPRDAMKPIAFVTITAATAAARNWTPADPCPTEIVTTIPAVGIPDDDAAVFGTMQSVHDALVACADIRRISLRVARIGCSGVPDRWSLPLDLTGDDRYLSAPEEVSLEGHNLHASRWDEVRPPRGWADRARWLLSDNARLWWRWRNLPPDQRAKTTLELWLDAMNWTRLRTLAVNASRGGADADSLDGRVAKLLRWQLPELRELRVDGLEARDFMVGLPETWLQFLTWRNGNWGDNGAFGDVMRRHGSLMKSLELHSDESLQRPRPVLSADQIGELRNFAPGLRSLTLDLPRRRGDWPWEELRGLAALPSLSNLTVYVNLARAEGSFAEPQLDCDGALQMAVFAHRNRKTAPLRRILFRAGDWARPWDGPDYLPGWLEGKRVWTECSLPDEEESPLGLVRCHNEKASCSKHAESVAAGIMLAGDGGWGAQRPLY